MKTPLALPWERIPRLDSGVRIRMPIAATLGCGVSVILGRDPVLGIKYGIPETLHPALPGPEDRVVDFPEAAGTYSVEAVRALDTHRTPIQKQPKML
uniref:Uncharacterized protein n=1 Tax=Tanacetum cinerariifolium TaxID=118510 RepID=A0A6L2J380_TANCI|nr:hypothetical protein [Tanacetum cinerariifolium]